MIYVFNKNRILSYLSACSFVLMLFCFHDGMIKNKDVELVKVSSNVVEETNLIDSNNN